MKTSMLFNLVFVNNTISSCFFFFLLIIDLHFLILAVIPQTFNYIAKLVILIGMPSNGAKAEIEIYTVTTEVKVGKLSI